jgi:hypothetical protein
VCDDLPSIYLAAFKEIADESWARSFVGIGDVDVSLLKFLFEALQ